ncbi:MAG: diacylglycerol kinase [Candidatus Pacebacteria bacterium]|nr:diacylglycerol kinase [Candidatus Paceibacterota bacterium]
MLNWKNIISPKKLFFSFRSSFHGLKIAFLEEHSFKIQVFLTVLLLILMFSFPLHHIERAILVLAVIIVLGLELLNSQIERVLDMAQFDHNPRIKDIKDLSSAAVLIAAVGALIIGLFIFIPYLV